MKVIDLVADVGESYGPYRHGDDERLIPLLSSANVACGFHAGDPRVMHATVTRCIEAGVHIGAHPGFADIQGFGRRDMGSSEHEVYTDTLYQLGALRAMAEAQGARLAHVSPHGRLGNLVQSRADLARGVARAIHDAAPELVALGLPGVLAEQASSLGLTSANIGFVDRAYRADGSLVPRGEPGAVLQDPDEIARRAVRLVTEERLWASDGTDLRIRVESILLHGDNPTAVASALRVRTALEAAGVVIAPVTEVLRARRHAADV